ncbi:MAG: acyltransferase [Planctomycetes bacterium]|nr:acyltransferase [Planctomycetota bacterium]
MTPHEKFASARYFGSLDALRCIAIVGVIWQHTRPVPPEMLPFTDIGASGVALFFVLSGFLITSLLRREEAAAGSINLRHFYARRALRIFPLYFAVLGIYTLLVFLREHDSSGHLNAAGRLFVHNLPYYATYTNNWFVDLMLNEDGERRVIFVFAWSLATEEQFYAFWPPVLRYLPRRIAVGWLLAVMAIDLVLTFWFGPIEQPRTLIERLVRIGQSPATEICIGVLWAMALSKPRSFERLWAVVGRKWSSPFFAALSLGIAMWPWGDTPLWYLLQSIVFGFFVASCVIREDHGISRPLKFPVLARVGVVSYGMYMLHMLAVNAVRVGTLKVGMTSKPLIFVLSVLLTYLMAEASYRFFEQRFLRLKSRFMSPASRPSVPRQAHPSHS